MYNPVHVIQGIRYFFQSIKQEFTGPTKYRGNAEDICRQIVEACWNGKYFQTSTHHYKEFWVRDFGYCVESLVKLGYREEVRKTLYYALEKFQKTGIKTTITRGGTPFSFPDIYSPDSVALTVHALRATKDEDLIEKYEEFVQGEIDAFANIVLQDGMVRRHAHFSGMRDYARHDSSCYTHCMAILLAREAKNMGFKFPYTEKELVKKLDAYWKGYYRDDKSNPEASGDANTLPYWLGIGKDFKSSLQTMQKLGLDQPIPLSYSSKPHPHMLPIEIFVPGWQHDSIWPFLGFLWMRAAKKYDGELLKQYKKMYAEVIKQHGTLYEVYTLHKQPYRSLFYHADEGMLWAAMYLTL
jgi:hypothetical protein